LIQISGFISKAGLLLLFIAAAWRPVSAQDTLRTYGPRFGVDLARFVYILADPSEIGAEVSADFELVKDFYPIFELGYNSISESDSLFNYAASGTYARVGIDYNLLKLRDRSQHHAITIGARYGISLYSHSAENIYIQNPYWGDYVAAPYEMQLRGHWVELVGGIKAELLPNLFMGWSFRFKILLNPDMDPLVTPQMVPGFGTGGKDRSFGISYSIYYKIPLLKK
jgi:hypothetical protein